MPVPGAALQHPGTGVHGAQDEVDAAGLHQQVVLAAVGLARGVEVPVVGDGEGHFAGRGGEVERVLGEGQDGLPGGGEGGEPALAGFGEVEGREDVPAVV